MAAGRAQGHESPSVREEPLAPPAAQAGKEHQTAKQRALDACAAQHSRLIKCLATEASWKAFNGAWFCAEQNKEFWACYEKERGGIQWRPKAFLQEMMRVPEGLRQQQLEAEAAAQKRTGATSSAAAGGGAAAADNK